MLLILNDILDFSKIEAGKLDLEATTFSLRDCLGDALKALSIRAHQKELELAWHVAPDVPDSLIGDPGRLRQIIVNLLGNAIKFTEHGEVVLDVMNESRLGDQVELYFSVRDTGGRHSGGQTARSFSARAFSQADTSTTRTFGGTGLGLTISMQLVGMMGGRIWVRLKANSATASTFCFVAKFAIEGDGIAKLPANLADLKGLPVLIVDDNATNRRILEEIFLHWQRCGRRQSRTVR